MRLWGEEGTRVTPGVLETMAVFQLSLSARPPTPHRISHSPYNPCSLAYPVHLEDHWIGNNRLPASQPSPPTRDTSGPHLLPSQRGAVRQGDGGEQGAEQIRESN